MLQSFRYLAPDSMEELHAVLKKLSGKSRILAGGTDIMVELHNQIEAPESLIDIKKIKGLHEINCNSKSGLRIGGTVTCFEIVSDKNIQKNYPLLADAANRIGSPQLRNRATIAGNLCTGSPCADTACALLALGASVELSSVDGVRTVALKDFFIGPKKTQIATHEVLQTVIIPADSAKAAYGMKKLKRIKGHDIALVSLAIVKTEKVMRVGIGSCAPTPVVTIDLKSDSKLDKVVAAVEKVISPINDMRASRDYRVFMVKDFVEKIYRKLV